MGTWHNIECHIYLYINIYILSMVHKSSTLGSLDRSIDLMGEWRGGGRMVTQRLPVSFIMFKLILKRQPNYENICESENASKWLTVVLIWFSKIKCSFSQTPIKAQNWEEHLTRNMVFFFPPKTLNSFYFWFIMFI